MRERKGWATAHGVDHTQYITHREHRERRWRRRRLARRDETMTLLVDDEKTQTKQAGERADGRTDRQAGRQAGSSAYKLINKTTAFYWNVKAEYWYSSRGLPKICTPASCMLMTDAGTHEASIGLSSLASGCQRESLDQWRHGG